MAKLLNGKVAIVTGSSRGIGKAIAEVFAADGAKVVCAARTLNEGDFFLEGSVSTTVAGIKKAGGTAIAVQADVSNEESCAHLVEATTKEFGPVDVLVNDAALRYTDTIEDLSIKRWIISFAVNVHGPLMLIKMVLPDMIKRKAGAIVNISSGTGAGGPGRGPYRNMRLSRNTPYGASKAALERLSQGLASEVYQYGITVACLSPSEGVATPGTVYNKLYKSLDDPRGEKPEMMAKAALLMATESLDNITGRCAHSQAILKEFGWIKEGKGYGIDSVARSPYGWGWQWQ